MNQSIIISCSDTPNLSSTDSIIHRFYRPPILTSMLSSINSIIYYSPIHFYHLFYHPLILSSTSIIDSIISIDSIIHRFYHLYILSYINSIIYRVCHPSILFSSLCCLPSVVTGSGFSDYTSSSAVVIGEARLATVMRKKVCTNQCDYCFTRN